jgi:aryl-alcohol dehydrogenase-like predicted oxidoreductase
MRLGMDYVDLFQIHRFDHSTPVEETMEALHDLVKSGKVRYIGASSMEAWRFAKMQHTAERNGWTRFITMQPQYNLLYREEEREMLPLCEDQGVGVIPWSPMARGRLTRDWSVTSRRTQNDAFALKMYENAALLDKPVIDVVASIAEKHHVPRAHVALAWLLSKTVITAPIIGATKPEHLSTAISALDFHLAMLKSRNSRHSICRTPSTGSFPRFLIRPLHSRRLQQYRTVNTLPGPALPGLLATDVKNVAITV